MPRYSLPEIPLARQLTGTSCWISAAHYVMQYMPALRGTPLQALMAFQKLDAKSHSVMDGAGKPTLILQAYGQRFERVALQRGDQDAARADAFGRIAVSIQGGLPVICYMNGAGAHAYFRHAIIIVGIDTDAGTITYKNPSFDPGTARSCVTMPYATFCTHFWYGTDNSSGAAVAVHAYADMFVFLNVAAPRPAVFAVDAAIPERFRRSARDNMGHR